MNQQQVWFAPKQQEERSPSLPSLSTILCIRSQQGNRLRLQEHEVAAAESLQQLAQTTPRHLPPSPSEEWVSIKPANDFQKQRLRPSTSSEWVMVKPNHGSQKLRLPSFDTGFADAIAASDRSSYHSAHSSIADTEYSYMAPSPASTAHTSPNVSPTTTYYNILPQIQDDVESCYPTYQENAESLKRHLARKSLRRVSSRATVLEGVDKHGQPTVSKQLRRPASTSSLKSNRKGKVTAPHFNQKYKVPDRLFVVYCKEDLKKSWPEIQTYRLKMLHILLGKDYDPSVEEKREVNGLNGMYYRENEVMPVLSADGKGLEFVEKDGRWWECVRSQKCRAEDNGEGGRRKSSASDARPRGMVDRYPEEVLEYWDNHVQYFVPTEKRADILARARENTRIRRAQREYYRVPPWTLDNKEDRILDITPKDPSKIAESMSPSVKARSIRRKARN